MGRAANLMTLTPSIGRFLESEILFRQKPVAEGRIVVSARESDRRTARRCRSYLGVTAILAPADRYPHPSPARVNRGRRIANPRHQDCELNSTGLRSSALGRGRCNANSCAVIRQVVPSPSVDTRAQVFVRTVIPCPCATTLAAVMVVSISLFDGRAPRATSNGRIRPEGRLHLDRLPATAKPAFFPCREVAAFLAGQTKKPSDAVLRCGFRA
jgi:hypothetical protein